MRFLLIELNEQAIFLIMDQLLNKLAIEKLSKMGEKGEGEAMVEGMNKSVISIIENSDCTISFIVLLKLFAKYKRILAQNETKVLIKVPEMIIKCILKLCKALPSIISTLDVPAVLLGLHNYLLENVVDYQSCSRSEEMGIRIVKTILSDLVKLRKESIWDDYNSSVEIHPGIDFYLKRWINIVLKNTDPDNGPIDILHSIFEGFRFQATFDQSIKELLEYIKKHPKTDLEKYLSSYSRAFSQLILTSLNEYKNGTKNKESKMTPDGHEKKMAKIKQKLELIQSEGKVTTRNNFRGVKKSNTVIKKTQNTNSVTQFMKPAHSKKHIFL